jgi:hypothetical protein
MQHRIAGHIGVKAALRLSSASLKQDKTERFSMIFTTFKQESDATNEFAKECLAGLDDSRVRAEPFCDFVRTDGLPRVENLPPQFVC